MPHFHLLVADACVRVAVCRLWVCVLSAGVASRCAALQASPVSLRPAAPTVVLTGPHSPASAPRTTLACCLRCWPLAKPPASTFRPQDRPPVRETPPVLLPCQCCQCVLRACSGARVAALQPHVAINTRWARVFPPAIHIDLHLAAPAPCTAKPSHHISHDATSLVRPNRSCYTRHGPKHERRGTGHARRGGPPRRSTHGVSRPPLCTIVSHDRLMHRVRRPRKRMQGAR